MWCWCYAKLSRSGVVQDSGQSNASYQENGTPAPATNNSSRLPNGGNSDGQFPNELISSCVAMMLMIKVSHPSSACCSDFRLGTSSTPTMTYGLTPQSVTFARTARRSSVTLLKSRTSSIHRCRACSRAAPRTSRSSGRSRCVWASSRTRCWRWYPLQVASSTPAGGNPS